MATLPLAQKLIQSYAGGMVDIKTPEIPPNPELQPAPRARALRTKALSCAIALAGVAAFVASGLPLPWLLGPMLACLLAALLGVRMAGLPVASNAMRTILGVAVGASITPDAVGRMGEMAASIALIPPFIIVIGLIGTPYFHKLWKFDVATSYYSAMPGGLQDMLIFGEAAGGSARILSLVHATRVLIIVSALPLILSVYMTIDLTVPPGIPAADLPASQGALMIATALLGWWGALRVRLFGASILGPMILTAAASMSGLLVFRPPAEAILAAQFFIGLSVGVKYAGITLAEIRRVITAAVGYVAILAVLSAIFAEIVIYLGLAPVTEAILAFSPGGQAEMALLAIIAGADVAFVVTHHIVRIVTVIVGAPLVRRWLT